MGAHGTPAGHARGRRPFLLHCCMLVALPCLCSGHLSGLHHQSVLRMGPHEGPCKLATPAAASSQVSDMTTSDALYNRRSVILWPRIAPAVPSRAAPSFPSFHGFQSKLDS